VGLRRDENVFRFSTVSAQCLHLSERFFILNSFFPAKPKTKTNITTPKIWNLSLHLEYSKVHEMIIVSTAPFTFYDSATN